jgi:hypothetical protein
MSMNEEDRRRNDPIFDELRRHGTVMDESTVLPRKQGKGWMEMQLGGIDLSPQLSPAVVLSQDQKYRYWLERGWGGERPVCFIMFNPSTADHEADDPTVRRCMRFARDWNRDGIIVVNLFAYRTPHPADLDAQEDPVGPDNDKHIQAALANEHVQVVAAWGATAARYPQRLARVRQIIRGSIKRRKVSCLGLTNGGYPRHPLYVPANAKRLDYL